MKKMCFITLGCRVNQYESRAIAEILEKSGYTEVPFSAECDIFIVNTCAVTGDAARKSRQMIRRAVRMKEKNPEAVVCAVGCFVEGEIEKTAENDVFAGVDAVISNGEKEKTAEKILECAANKNKYISALKASQVKKYQDMQVSGSKNARAFIKIEDGCNSFCSYCFVPFARGRVRSRNMDDIIEEAIRLSENGYREIVLTGIETGSYGEDLESGVSLAELVERLSRIEKLERIRFGSLKPVTFTEDFLSRISRIKKVMPHFHLSLQSGSSKVLSEMNRHYDRKDENEAIKRIYSYFPDAGLSADIICGFPGESDDDFEDTRSLVMESGLLHTHIFPYSPREGTIAAKRKDTVSEEIKSKRCEILLQDAKKASLLFAERYKGRKFSVLCERIKAGKMYGYTDNFIYTETPCPAGTEVGKIYDVELGSESVFSVETLIVKAKISDF